MLDAIKYAQHFPDEDLETARAKPVSAPDAARPSLLAALHKLEKEFRDILLRAQGSEHPDGSE
jgi:hypothetical protein